MNAHTSITPGLVPDDAHEGACEGLGHSWDGVARHVSADGCQLVITGEAPGAGQRLSFAIECGATITGSIQWVVGSRAGFVFDHRIDAATATGLSNHLAKFRTLELRAIASLPSPE